MSSRSATPPIPPCTGPASLSRPADGTTTLTEAKEFFKMFDNSLENNPYMVMFGQGDWTCTIAKWKGTMIGPMRGADGKMIPATHKSFSLEFCTVAHWRNGEIVEEKLFYDQVGLLKQIGVM
jgi:hypothetical protein